MVVELRANPPPPPALARVTPALSAMTRAGVGVSSRSRRPTHHLWRFDARRDARLVFWPKAASAVERGGVYAPHQQPPRKPRRPSLHHHPVKGAGVFPAS